MQQQQHTKKPHKLQNAIITSKSSRWLLLIESLWFTYGIDFLCVRCCARSTKQVSIDAFLCFLRERNKKQINPTSFDCVATIIDKDALENVPTHLMAFDWILFFFFLLVLCSNHMFGWFSFGFNISLNIHVYVYRSHWMDRQNGTYQYSAMTK